MEARCRSAIRRAMDHKGSRVSACCGPLFRGAGDLGGALEENCGPHLTAVLQPADRTLYRVPTLDPRRPLISFPPPLPHPRTCLLVTGKNSAAPERTFSSALVSAEWRGRRENERGEER